MATHIRSSQTKTGLLCIEPTAIFISKHDKKTRINFRKRHTNIPCKIGHSSSFKVENETIYILFQLNKKTNLFSTFSDGYDVLYSIRKNWSNSIVVSFESQNEI